MKTGNSILAVFFWLTSLTAPVGIMVITTTEQFKSFKEYIPFGLTPLIFSLIVFAVLLVLGCIAGAFGIERKKKIKNTDEIQKKVEKETELRPAPVDEDLFS